MSFCGYIFSPKLYKEYGDNLPDKYYEPGGLEKWGDQIISTLSLMWNIGYYTSPLIVTFLYRRGYFVAESITTFGKISTGIGLLVVISLCMRGIGRSQNKVYEKFLKALDAAKANARSEEAKNALRSFDFEFKDWPVDFSVKDVAQDSSKTKNTNVTVATPGRSKPFWISSLPCEIAAYIAIHSFGIRMIYPGSVKLIQSYLRPMLIQGRAKLIEQDHAKRYKLRTIDDNDVDTIFVDNRGKSALGATVVICSEGNAGFYEIGILSTPLSLKYSVIGWNHPGFGGSTGSPYPEQDHQAMDAVMQFAIHKLGFMPENIVLFGWSIGGYSSLLGATLYPDVRGLILDATFDDVLQLALPRMPQSLSGIVRIAIRQYMNLNNTELLAQYNGPVLMIRRTEDEVISEDMDVSTNRGNNLLLALLKLRYPNVYKAEQIATITKILSKPIERSKRPTSVLQQMIALNVAKSINSTDTDAATDQLCLSLLMSYVSEHGKSFPLEIGADYTLQQRNQLAEFLLHKHLLDYKSSHCTPLPGDYFQIPWSVPDDDKEYVFT